MMKNNSYHIYLSSSERSYLLNSLIDLKNHLTAEGRYTDAVDEVIVKITQMEKKKLPVRYI